MRLVLLALAALVAYPVAGQDRPPPIATIRLVTPTSPGGPDVTVTALGVVTRAYGRQVYV